MTGEKKIQTTWEVYELNPIKDLFTLINTEPKALN